MNMKWREENEKKNKFSEIVFPHHFSFPHQHPTFRLLLIYFRFYICNIIEYFIARSIIHTRYVFTCRMNRHESQNYLVFCGFSFWGWMVWMAWKLWGSEKHFLENSISLFFRTGNCTIKIFFMVFFAPILWNICLQFVFLPFFALHWYRNILMDYYVC